MDENTEFDVIVVGAGMAGVACAGELLVLGLRPLLICETPEVGWNLRGTYVDGNVGYVQHPIWALGWGGGWWYDLARRLNANVSFEVGSGVDIAVRGTGEVRTLPFCASPSALFDAVSPLAPIPVDELRPEFERVLGIALAIPWQELTGMVDIPVAAWLREQNADPMLTMLILMMVANLYELTPRQVGEHISVLGAIGIFRGLWCGETPGVIPDPDPQLGIVVPMARAIEAGGGEVWRRAKVEQILFEGGRVHGVRLVDGREVHAPVVALSAGTKRLQRILKEPTPEVEACLAAGSALTGHDITTYTVLDKPVCTLAHYTVLADETGSNLAFLFPMHKLSPRHVQPGMQFLAAQAFFRPEQFEEHGGEDGAVQHLLDLQEEMFPGFKDAAVKTVVQQHRHHWFDALRHSAKLPSRSPDIAGLWYANDASMPVGGLAVESAASAGVLRARQSMPSVRLRFPSIAAGRSELARGRSPSSRPPRTPRDESPARHGRRPPRTSSHPTRRRAGIASAVGTTGHRSPPPRPRGQPPTSQRGRAGRTDSPRHPWPARWRTASGTTPAESTATARPSPASPID
jgi:glycine/D-amino acid oxidase-like deaminating enzyme